jgi:hypothetical protein
MRPAIEEFIATGGRSGSFEALALGLFAEQYEAVALYRRFCDARGASPATVADWRSIPALPADAFRHRLRDGEAPPHVFLSSGTTQSAEGRSRHELSTLDTYRASALVHFEAMVLPDAPGPLATLILGPTAATHSHSSLGRMFSWIAERHAASAQVVFDEHGSVAADDALDWLRGAAAGVQPCCCSASARPSPRCSTPYAGAPSRCGSPPHSRIVDTGGAKTYAPPVRSRARTRRARCSKPRGSWLHVPAYMCVNEYGMTEMLSQFYDDALASRVAGRLTPRAKVGRRGRGR